MVSFHISVVIKLFSVRHKKIDTPGLRLHDVTLLSIVKACLAYSAII